MSGTSGTSRFRFGVFELDVERGELRRAGVELHLQAQPLKLLGLLVAHAGRTVSRDEIREHVWSSDTHVDFDRSINAAVRQIRSVLHDTPEAPRFLHTIPREGYRFIAEVEPIGEPRGAPASPGRGVGWKTGAAAAMALSLIAAAALAIARPWSSKSALPPAPTSLLVLPFELYGDDREDLFFSDALTEELIAQLGRQYGARLNVIARTSAMKYKGSVKAIDEIAEELGADYVLEGSVRRVDERMRIVAQLIRASDQAHVWSSAFQRESEDLMALQVELGETISRGMALKLLPNVSTPSGATSPEVYELYLQGRHALTSEGLAAALPILERVVSRDPAFAPGWVGLARIYRSLPAGAGGSLPKARDAIARALALDGELPEAHFVMATIRFYKDYDLEGARESFERAIALNPGYADAHHNFAAYFSVRGRHEEAIESVQRARRVDPLSSMINSDVGWYYYFARRFDEAIEHSERTLTLDPDFYWARLCIQLAYLQTGDHSAALERARREMAEAKAEPATIEDYWRWRLARLEARQARNEFVSPDAFAQVHMALGEREQALEALEIAFESRTGWLLPFLTVDPLFDPVREDQRFRDLLARISSGG